MKGKLLLNGGMKGSSLFRIGLLTCGALLLGVASGTLGLQSAEQTQREGINAADVSALYPSSVVGTDFDFITDDDPSSFDRLEYIGFKEFEMPDKRGGGEPLVQNAYVFAASFNDSTKISIALDQDFGSRQEAERDAVRYMPRLGKLPSIYRKNLRHVVVHKGGADTTSFAEDKGHFFIIYSDNATKRIATHDLEETFFHEATHASIQYEHLQEAAWRNAAARDGAHITKYAATDEQEDFAESALFAYALIHHPERFPAAEREKIERQIPNRISFFRQVFEGPKASVSPSLRRS